MKNNYLNNNKIAKDLAIKISRIFSQKRIISFLYFGTRAFDLNTNENSDHDFILVLDKYAPEDTMKLRGIIKKRPFVDSDINLNLLYLSDLYARGRTNFQIRSLSLTFYKYLENAKPLIGKNIFEKSRIKLSQKNITRLEDFKIQEYYGRCDKLYFSKISDRDFYLHLRKYTKDIVWLLLIRQGVIEIVDLTKIPYTKMLELAISNNLISKSSSEDLRILLKNDYRRSNLRKLEKVRRLLYIKYLSLFKGNK